VAEENGLSIGIDAWTILEVSHEAESTSLKVLNHTSCQTSEPETYEYTMETSAISASSFRISSSNSFLYPAAKDEVVVTIDESGRILEFADYASEKFATTSVSGVVSTATLNINSDLSMAASFSRSDGVEASLEVDLLDVAE